MVEIQPIDLNKKTVFVLGAGANKPYGFPLGTELKQIMIKNLSNSDCQRALKEYKLNQLLIDEFIEALPRTYHSTIDIFLEKKKFRKLGAYLIAYSLLPLERYSRLFPQHNWYSRLYNIIDFDHDKPKAENIVFVVLNYDRSLEHFLYKNIQYNCPDNLIQFAESKLKSLRIIHAHGSLGRYPQVPYEDKHGEDVIRSAAENIRIASDRLEDSNDFRNAQEAISNAFNIVFIGFGYDPTTLHLLVQDFDMSEKRILGTGFQLGNSERERLDKFFKGKMEIGANGTTAEKFVQEFLLH